MRKEWLVSGALAIALAVTGFWGYSQYQERLMLEIQLNNKYQRALFDMVTHVENMEVLLSKGLVSSTPAESASIYSDIWYEATSAQKELGQLPILDDPAARRVAKFLTQTGDYANSLNRQAAGGTPPNSVDLDQLEALYRQSAMLNKELQEMQERILNGDISLGEVANAAERTIEQEGDDLRAPNFQKMDKQLEKMPALIYDGPFADHVNASKPKGLTGDKISVAKAQEIAQGFFDNKRNLVFQARQVGESEGKIPSYSIELFSNVNNGTKVAFSVSKTGGHVVYYLYNREYGENVLHLPEAIKIAEEFVKSRGYTSTEATYSNVQGNRAFITFAGVQEGVRIYPDLLKVQVALDDGQVVGFDATSYLMNHHQREIPVAKVTEQEVRNLVNPRVEVESIKKVIIPSESKKEKFCYEVKGRFNEEEYFIYFNALNGTEEQILKVINTREGNLAM